MSHLRYVIYFIWRVENMNNNISSIPVLTQEVILSITLREDDDEFDQKCFASIDVFHQLRAKNGSFVEIHAGELNGICSMWPQCELRRSSICFSNIVSQTSVGAYQDGKESAQAADEVNKEFRIKLLDVVEASIVHVDLVLNDICEVAKLRCRSSTASVEKQCHFLLQRLCVQNERTIFCKSSKYAKLCGIANITINNVTAISASVADGFRITKKTKVIIDNIHSDDWYQHSISVKSLRKPGGLDDVINMLIDSIELPRIHKEKFRHLGISSSRGILLKGPPGCGKTSLVQYTCNKLKTFLLTINGPELFGPYPGETESNLRQIFERAKCLSLEGTCVLFIDEIDSLCPKQLGSRGVHASRVTSHFLNMMDGLSEDSNIIVIAATNRPSSLDPALRRPGRLDIEVIINPPTQAQRREILQTCIEDCCSRVVGSDVNLDKLAEITNGYVGADLSALCSTAAYLAMISKDDMVRQDHFMQALKKVRPSIHKGAEGIVDIRPVSWVDIGGLNDVKLQMKQAIEAPLKYPHAFQRMGLKSPKGVLLYGPPGCCKTVLVRAAATACHRTFLSISGAQLYSCYFGDSERLISEVFEKARSCSPTILFIDELDAIVGKRSESQQTGVQERVLSTLLNELDGIGIQLDKGAISFGQQKLLEGTSNEQKANGNQTTAVDNRTVLVVAATNRLDLIDEALLRPGRMDKLIYVGPPDLQARKLILSIYTKKMTVECDLDRIAAQTEMYTGADLENLCREAALNVLNEDIITTTVTQQHFDRALQTVKPSLTIDLIQKYAKRSSSTFAKR